MSKSRIIQLVVRALFLTVVAVAGYFVWKVLYNVGQYGGIPFLATLGILADLVGVTWVFFRVVGNTLEGR